MMVSLKFRMRVALVVILAALSTALVVTPVYVAGNLAHLEIGTVVAVCVIGFFLFAVAYEIWHFASRRPMQYDSEFTRN